MRSKAHNAINNYRGDGYWEGKVEGLAEGIAKGKTECSWTIAKNLLAAEIMTIKQIAEATGLPEIEVESLS